MKYLTAQIGKPLTIFSSCATWEKATIWYCRVPHNSIPEFEGILTCWRKKWSLNKNRNHKFIFQCVDKPWFIVFDKISPRKITWHRRRDMNRGLFVFKWLFLSWSAWKLMVFSASASNQTSWLLISVFTWFKESLEVASLNRLICV